jgi:hypothetical protein
MATSYAESILTPVIVIQTDRTNLKNSKTKDLLALLEILMAAFIFQRLDY